MMASHPQTIIDNAATEGFIESAHDHAVEAPPLSAAELAELAVAFNSVAARLQQTQETLRSEVRRLESELSDSRKELKRARELAQLGEMAAGIAHEIRNPLGSMKLYARLLIEDLGAMPAEQATARKIALGVDRVNEIVTDVLALARDLKVERREHVLRTLIETAVSHCVQTLQDAGVTITIDPSIDEAAAYCCDGPLMQQAVTNLIRNACEAIAEWEQRPASAGHITIALERRSVLLANGKRQAMAVLSVTDDGPGIDDAAIERAFNPFYTTRETGTGLGLAIVHRVLDAHGGWARIFPNHGLEQTHPTGTTAELLLPESSWPTVNTEAPTIESRTPNTDGDRP